MSVWFSSVSGESLFAGGVAIVAALLGALVSLVASLAVFRLSSKNELDFHRSRVLEMRNTSARVGFAKLISTFNQLHSIDKSLSEQLRLPEHIRFAEPGLLVGSQVVGYGRVDFLTGQEAEFLLHSKSGSLMTEIQLFQQKVATHFSSLSAYSRMREKYDDFCLANAELVQLEEGDEVKIVMDEGAGRRAEVHVAELNKLLGDISVSLATDLEIGRSLLEQFREVAAEMFGEDFPKVGDQKGTKKC